MPTTAAAIPDTYPDELHEWQLCDLEDPVEQLCSGRIAPGGRGSGAQKGTSTEAGVMQDVIEASKPAEAPVEDVATLRRQNRWLKGIAGVLAISLMLSVGLALFEEGPPSRTPEQDRMIATIDTYLGAWNSGDPAAAEAVMAPDAFMEDVSGRWLVADGSHADYLKFVHWSGFRFYRVGEPVVVGRIVIVPTGASEDAPSPATDVYYMSADGTEILWMIEPW